MLGKDFKSNEATGKAKESNASMPAGYYALGFKDFKSTKIGGNSVDLIYICAVKCDSEDEAKDFELTDDCEMLEFRVGNKLAGALGVGSAESQEKAAHDHTMWAVKLEKVERTDPTINEGKPYTQKIWENLGKL